jgi:uncharacterized membrane protein YdjX (TVP38/TMEM64 family)
MNPRWILRGCLALLVAALAYWIVSGSGTIPVPAFVTEKLARATELYQLHPTEMIAVFCLAHVLAACLSIPGSCITLNIFSGAVFGFHVGCLVVYPITLLSACIGYFAAVPLLSLPLVARQRKKVDALRDRLGDDDFLFLVSLRLSPIFPYGVLNLALGLLRVPFPTFLASTFVGVFFDVVILNGVGAAIAASGKGPAFDGKWVLGAFFALVFVLLVARKLASKKIEKQ